VSNGVIPEILLYFALPLIALVLLFGWLILVLRGDRAVSVKLQGFGVSLDVTSSKPQPQSKDGLPRKTNLEK